jgi:hypothetical protein
MASTQYLKEYRLKNKDKIKQYQKEYSLKNKQSKKLYYLKNKEKQKENYLKNKEQIKEYRKLYYLNNKEKLKEYSRQYRLDNKEKIKEKDKLFYLNNKEKIKKVNRLYRLNKPHIHSALSAKRRAVKLKATPRFANLKKIKEIYMNCPKGYHVDHIVPLQGKNVCGLHVEWNLQYLTPLENSFKSNKLN